MADTVLSPDHIFVLGLDFSEAVFVHAVVPVQDSQSSGDSYSFVDPSYAF